VAIGILGKASRKGRGPSTRANSAWLRPDFPIANRLVRPATIYFSSTRKVTLERCPAAVEAMKETS